MQEYVNRPWDEVIAELTEKADLAICDPIYASKDLSYIPAMFGALRPGASLYVFGDCSRIAETKLGLDDAGFEFRNWLIWPNDWGGRSPHRYPQKHDDILYYVKPGGEVRWHPERIQIPKKMVGKAFNPSGRSTKTPPSVWQDLAGFSTVASERVRIDGKCVRWQKPQALIRRMILASSDPEDLVLDPFGGVATVPAVCRAEGRHYLSCEIDPVIHKAGTARLKAL